MTKLQAFVRLDFVTVKPYFTLKTMLIFAVVAFFLTVTSENVSAGMGVGLMIGTMFIGYPFTLSEKSNMDALYATLSVNRKTVVQGRYIFTLLLNGCAILFSVILAAVALFAAKAFGFGTGVGGSLEMVLVLSAVFLIIQAVQLPIYFKFGYTKAKFLSIIPFAALMAGYLAFMAIGNANGGSPDFIVNIFSSAMTVPLLIVLLLLAVFVSYNLSLVFYKKREF